MKQTEEFQAEKVILVIDDDKEICELLSMFLSLEKYKVLVAETGLQGLDYCRTENIDLIILDIGLPDISGQQLCKLIRQESSIPIIILSANDSVPDKVICLEYGADDYLSKPFENIELIARIRAIFRRIEQYNDDTTSSSTVPEINFAGLTISLTSRNVLRDGKNINLTPKEFDLLLYFSEHVNQTLKRDQIIEDLWGKNTLYRWSRSLDVHIQNLRQKIEINPKNPAIIQTVSGIGYKING